MSVVRGMRFVFSMMVGVVSVKREPPRSWVDCGAWVNEELCDGLREVFAWVLGLGGGLVAFVGLEAAMEKVISPVLAPSCPAALSLSSALLVTICGLPWSWQRAEYLGCWDMMRFISL